MKPTGLDAIAGWGLKTTSDAARAYARKHRLPYVALEDGFLRSVGLGVAGYSPYSIVIDEKGVYYNAAWPSRLENYILEPHMDPVLLTDAKGAIALVIQNRLSKYNHAPASGCVSLPAGKKVLVIDQTAGDMSVSGGFGTADVFSAMLEAAIAENPDAAVLVKTHPDVLSGKKQGYLTNLADDERIICTAADLNPAWLIEQVDKVYVVTSQMGFEALMLRKSVVCFGQPWYAGWGLTDDRHPGMDALRERRNVKRTLEELFAAAYLQYARYIDPVTGKPGTIFHVIDWLARNKEANDVTRGELWCVGMSMWKRAIVRPFLDSPSTRVRFARSPAQLARMAMAADAKVVIWGIKNEKAVREVAAQKQVPVWRMEDGFLRSVGLGSDLHRPVSLVLDRSGMYYDPASASELETMLANQALSEEDLQRAVRFRQAYVDMRASKYNIGGKPIPIPASGRRVLLVPGQVEDDASIQRGSPLVTSNLALLRQVRERNPDAYIVYKPHPDVVAGNRRGAIDAQMLNGLVDQCVPDANIIDCIAAADEVHTMTSLSGFEALLHGRVVHCYGGPFYAGWGLTVDHFPLPHRQRRIALDELVFAAMLKYPRYALPGVSGLASAEQVLTALLAQAASSGTGMHRTGLAGWIDRKLRKAGAIGQLLFSGRRGRAAW
ncbi:capsular polysaccharide biosynthesis protein [Noviherbaspirillum sp. 1P10PC]|uniref:capsular polysaccharide biosynthesis protein n=1 Tax=Noviherbaspirillum sp. 1P10PC TaxID=3132292 RepID=UPI00399FE91D